MNLKARPCERSNRTFAQRVDKPVKEVVGVGAGGVALDGLVPQVAELDHRLGDGDAFVLRVLEDRTDLAGDPLLLRASLARHGEVPFDGLRQGVQIENRKKLQSRTEKITKKLQMP